MVLGIWSLLDKMFLGYATVCKMLYHSDCADLSRGWVKESKAGGYSDTNIQLVDECFIFLWW